MDTATFTPGRLTGYGRTLTAAERQALTLFAARLGVSYLHAGLTKQTAYSPNAGTSFSTA
ncbi:hypothetical protein AB0C68_30550 [Streptomyces tendae]